VAERLIRAGRVFADAERVATPGQLLRNDRSLELRAGRAFVSRGGEKLERALEHFALDVEGAVCIDAGCSTGGFTDCLLRRGAALVHAVDVGYGQLAWDLRRDPRVVVRERTNVRHLAVESLDPRPDFLVADLSFVSLRSLLPALARLLPERARMLLLVKPQFELSREQAPGGVVRDPRLHAESVSQVESAAAALGFVSRGNVASALVGPAGNREFFVSLARS
jgi:23S rRNA (cytidine1920-2'-O)/16S rRNA (cytidine1409-2'-O)-methyltransferase